MSEAKKPTGFVKFSKATPGGGEGVRGLAGVRPSAHNGQQIISTGLHDLDCMFFFLAQFSNLVVRVLIVIIWVGMQWF